jgi:hypothetical protein
MAQETDWQKLTTDPVPPGWKPEPYKHFCSCGCADTIRIRNALFCGGCGCRTKLEPE